MSDKNTTLLLYSFSFLVIGLHLYSNAFANYGIFRDELYYVACAEHPAFGYVDHPPFSIWILTLVINTIGKSIFAIRLVPALLVGASVYLFGKITVELGGKTIAIVLVCLSLLVSGIHQALGTIYSMNSIDLFVTALSLYIIVLLLKTRNPKYWIILGLILGFGCLNKISALFVVAGFGTALLISSYRDMLTTRWPWLMGGIVILLFAPYVVWNAMNDWAHLEFIHNASTMKYSGMNPKDFWLGQLLNNTPVTIPVWLAGIVYAIRSRNREYLFLFLIFVTVVVILTINWTSKPEYLAAVFPVLLVGGALQIERATQMRKWAYRLITVWLASGLLALPFALPILPPEIFVAYSKATGISPGGAEGHELSEMPQFYADMFGWEDKAAAIAKVYHSLPEKDQEICAIYGDNYGRSGTIDYYAEKYRLPKSIGRHNNYWLWGPRSYTGEVIIILSDEVGDKAELFESVEDMGIVTSGYAMPYENNLHIYVCRGLKEPIETLWPRIKLFI